MPQNSWDACLGKQRALTKLSCLLRFPIRLFCSRRTPTLTAAVSILTCHYHPRFSCNTTQRSTPRDCPEHDGGWTVARQEDSSQGEDPSWDLSSSAVRGPFPTAKDTLSPHSLFSRALRLPGFSLHGSVLRLLPASPCIA